MTRHAETLTFARPQGFAAADFAAAARWVADRTRPVASAERIAATLEALQSITRRAQRGPICIPDLLPGSGLEVLHIPADRPRVGQLAKLSGEIDQTALGDIGRALRAEFVVGETDMMRLESGDGSELIVYAIEVRAIVLAATNIQLIEGGDDAQD